MSDEIDMILSDISVGVAYPEFAEKLTAELSRLRAELAAEKEDVWKMRDVGLRAITGAIAAEKERCAKIAVDEAVRRMLQGKPLMAQACQFVANAIRASNAAPPHVEPSAAESEDAEVDRILSMSDAGIVSEALASGVDIEATAASCRAIYERSKANVDARATEAAESEKEPMTFKTDWDRENERIEAARQLRTATEARMVELARKEYSTPAEVMELRALVIKTFGGGK